MRRDRRSRERVPVAALGGVDPHEFGPPDRIPDRPGNGRRGQRPCLWLDATYVKAREGGRIVSRAVIVAVAVNEDGKREVLGVATGPSEACAGKTIPRIVF